MLSRIEYAIAAAMLREQSPRTQSSRDRNSNTGVEEST
jgi:hypothetical protein